MAKINNMIKFAVLESDATGYDTKTDTELVNMVGTDEDDGIIFGSIAKTDILNGLFRQLTKTNKVIGDLILNNATATDITLGTQLTDSAYEGYFKTSLQNITLGVSPAIVNPTVGGEAVLTTATKSGVTVNSQGLVTSVVSLVSTDIPALAISKITSLQTTLDAKAIKTRKIAGLTLEADRSRDDIIGVTTNGIIKRTGDNTYSNYTLVSTDIPALAISKITNLQTTLDGKVPTTRTVAGTALSANITQDNITGLSTTGVIKRTGVNTLAAGDILFSDMPQVAQNTFLGRTATGTGDVSALSRDSVIGVTTNGLIKRTGANTYSSYTLVADDIPDLAQSKIIDLENDLSLFAPLTTAVGSDTLDGGVSLDTMFDVSTNGFIIRTGVDTYGIDGTIYAPSSQVAWKDNNGYTTVGSSDQVIFWKGTQASYDTIVANNEIDEDVIYIIV